MQELNDRSFAEAVNGSKLAVVDFYATWCGPCKMLSPVLDEVEKGKSDFNFFKVDVDKNPELVKKYNISAMPTVVILKDGLEVKRFLGYRSKEEIENTLSLVK